MVFQGAVQEANTQTEGQVADPDLSGRYATDFCDRRDHCQPSSLTGFLLYGGTDYDAEIDIEILNNSDAYSGPDSGRNRPIWYTAYDEHCRRDTNGECVAGSDGQPVLVEGPTHHVK